MNIVESNEATRLFNTALLELNKTSIELERLIDATEKVTVNTTNIQNIREHVSKADNALLHLERLMLGEPQPKVGP